MTPGTRDDPQGFRLNEVDGALVVTFAGPKLTLDVSEPLYRLVEGDGHRRLVLNFEDIRVITSAPIGVLFNLKKKAEAVGGAVVLCRLDPDVLQILHYAHADRLFGVFDTERDAVASFRPE